LKIGVLTATDETRDIETDIQNTNLEVVEEIKTPTPAAQKPMNAP
jgi:hypothetical protein